MGSIRRATFHLGRNLFTLRVNDGKSGIWHSHTTIILHPNCLNSRLTRTSRAVLLLNFCCQKRWFDLGLYASLHFACRCQKHPCTNTTDLYFGRTISGLPIRSRRCSRNLNPRRCNKERMISSGAVFLPRMRPMFQLRRCLLSLSMLRIQSAGWISQRAYP